MKRIKIISAMGLCLSSFGLLYGQKADIRMGVRGIVGLNEYGFGSGFTTPFQFYSYNDTTRDARGVRLTFGQLYQSEVSDGRLQLLSLTYGGEWNPGLSKNEGIGVDYGVGVLWGAKEDAVLFYCINASYVRRYRISSVFSMVVEARLETGLRIGEIPVINIGVGISLSTR